MEEDRTVVQRSSPRSMRPGTRLNNVYEVERLVAQGGMGEVYRGFNIQTGDPVAIKMIRPEFSNDPEILDLFRREASILHSFTHDAIVRYFVFSVDPQIQLAYLAMEFVEGPSLKKRLASGPLPLSEVKVLQKRIASALQAAHQHGVVHRDVSPDNVIMPDGDLRSAKVIDFGIARARRAGEQTILGGSFAGKLNYASPEQMGLAGGDVTAKSDIYSFGLVLAEALLGKPIDMAGSQAEMIDKRRVVPAELSWVEPTMRPLLHAMLQPLPENRPSSMAEVAAWEPPEPSAPRALKAPGGCRGKRQNSRVDRRVDRGLEPGRGGLCLSGRRCPMGRIVLGASALGRSRRAAGGDIPDDEIAPADIAAIAHPCAFAGFPAGDKPTAANGGTQIRPRKPRPRRSSLRRRRNPPIRPRCP